MLEIPIPLHYLKRKRLVTLETDPVDFGLYGTPYWAVDFISITSGNFTPEG